MNENNINNNSTKYKATTNLNTAIENPQINVESATDINVQNLGYNNYVSNNNNTTTEFISNQYSSDNNSVIEPTPNNNSNNNIDSNLNSNNSNNNITNTSYSPSNSQTYSYEPTLEEKKVGEEKFLSTLLHSKEFKALIFIMLILCIFLLLMPYIYDFITNIKLMR